LEEARRTYEILNTELHDELPALYDSRILFLVTNLQTLFATEQVFHNETAKIYSELEAIVDKLATDSQRGSNTLRKQQLNAIKSSSPAQSPVKQLSNNTYQNQITTNGGSSVANSHATTADLPPGVLYRVKATYAYDKEDADELSFEVGDTICVIEYDDPEDQEEGWLMGQKEGTNEKGLFPANFTKPI